MSPDLLTVAEVAEHFGVSESRARHLLSDNGIERVCGYPADQVLAIPRPGQGARTDLYHVMANTAEDLVMTNGCTKLSSWGSCIQALAAGWINVTDLCPRCTSVFMQALDRHLNPEEPLTWHVNYLARAALKP